MMVREFNINKLVFEPAASPSALTVGALLERPITQYVEDMLSSVDMSLLKRSLYRPAHPGRGSTRHSPLVVMIENEAGYTRGMGKRDVESHIKDERQFPIIAVHWELQRPLGDGRHPNKGWRRDVFAREAEACGPTAATQAYSCEVVQ